MAGDADMVLVDGKVFTAVPDRPWARALAVRGDRLIAVGTNTQVERCAGRATKHVDLRGRVVVPGFIDAHAHVRFRGRARVGSPRPHTRPRGGEIPLARRRALETARGAGRGERRG